jgi:AcrR family transcriptional regulator
MMEDVPARTDRSEPVERTEQTGRTEPTEQSERTERSGRAAPMSRDDRRDALVDVFVQLAHREGRKPTTSEIAQEAGVAEGTIFRVFATKEALEREAVQAAFCPAPVRRRITAIDPQGTLRERLVDFTRIMQARFTEVFGLMSALGLTEPPNRGPHLACYEAGRHLRGATDDEDDHVAAHQPLLDSIHALLVHDEDHLVVPAADLVHRLRLLTFSGSHPGIADGRVLTPEEIVDTVLFGLVCRPRTTESGLGIAELYGQLCGDPRRLAEPLPDRTAYARDRGSA